MCPFSAHPSPIPVHPSIRLSVRPSIHLPIYPTQSSIHAHTYPTRPPVDLLLIYLFIHGNIHLSTSTDIQHFSCLPSLSSFLPSSSLSFLPFLSFLLFPSIHLSIDHPQIQLYPSICLSIHSFLLPSPVTEVNISSCLHLPVFLWILLSLDSQSWAVGFIPPAHAFPALGTLHTPIPLPSCGVREDT